MIIVFSLISLVSAWLTFYLIKKPNVTPTRASSVVSLLGVFLVFLINRLIAIDIDFYCLLIFGASFVGMCSSKRVKDFEVVFAAVVFTAVYIKISPQISHLGGALGASAFVSIITSRVLKSKMIELLDCINVYKKL